MLSKFTLSIIFGRDSMLIALLMIAFLGLAGFVIYLLFINDLINGLLMVFIHIILEILYLGYWSLIYYVISISIHFSYLY